MVKNTVSPSRSQGRAAACDFEPGWMAELRALAEDRFREMRWPDPSDEEWRRTDLSRFGLSHFPDIPEPRAAGEPAPRDAKHEGFAGRISFTSASCTRLSLAGPLGEQGVRLIPLSEALEEFEDTLKGLFGGAVREADNRLIPWHYAGLSHGALLFVPPFVEVPEPFLIELLAGEADTVLMPHVVVLIGQGARATVIQRSAGPAAKMMLWNAAADLSVADAGALSYLESQELPGGALVFRHTRGRAGRDARLAHFEASFGGRLVKTRVDCALEGSGAEARLEGVYFPGRGQHMDIRSVQRHTAPSASSRAYYKGAVKDDGRAIFQGMIEVSPGAARTDAFLTNRNLVLNDGARSDSIPSLKIGNNDVKCSHGSTTGRIDEEHMYYLQSRGLSEAEAKEMLLTGYFEDLVRDAPESFRETVLSAVRGRLSAGAPEQAS
jgi:Fe-S cluster assembly protein SufD